MQYRPRHSGPYCCTFFHICSIFIDSSKKFIAMSGENMKRNQEPRSKLRGIMLEWFDLLTTSGKKSLIMSKSKDMSGRYHMSTQLASRNFTCKRFKKLAITLFLIPSSFYAMEPEATAGPADPTQHAVRLINNGCHQIELLENPLPLIRLMRPHYIGIAATQVHDGIQELLPPMEESVRESRFNKILGLSILKLFRTMDQLAGTIMQGNRDDVIRHLISPEQRLIQLENDTFELLKGISVKPDASQPTHLLAQTVQAAAHVAQSPETVREFLPEDDKFGLSELIPSVARTGFAVLQHFQKKAVEHTKCRKLVEDLRRDVEDSEREPKIKYSLSNIERLITSLQEKGEVIHPELANYLRDERNIRLLSDTIKFLINPDRSPATLATVQRLPVRILQHLPKALLPAEAIDALKRDRGFKPSDFARISIKIGEELGPEQRRKIIGAIYAIYPDLPTETAERLCSITREEIVGIICPYITTETAEKCIAITKDAQETLTTAKKHLTSLTRYYSEAQAKEEKCLEFFRRLGEEHQVWLDERSRTRE